MKYFLKKSILPLNAIDQHLPQSGTILDLGCGEGTVSLYLASKQKRNILGFDLNKSKIIRAKQNAKSNTKFFVKDFIKEPFPKNISGCVLADVLHHITPPNQKILIQKISKSMKKGGVLIVKEINTLDPIRSKLSRLWDYLFYPQDKIYFLSKPELIRILEKNKFKVKHFKKHLLVPASIHLYISTRL